MHMKMHQTGLNGSRICRGFKTIRNPIDNEIQTNHGLKPVSGVGRRLPPHNDATGVRFGRETDAEIFSGAARET
jgi:hypothetical protein